MNAALETHDSLPGNVAESFDIRNDRLVIEAQETLREETPSVDGTLLDTRTPFGVSAQFNSSGAEPSREEPCDNPTVCGLLFKPVTPGFANLAVTRKVWVFVTGKELVYSCWMQNRPAPLVFYIPGLGSYRLDRSTVAYADMMYRHGYSVVAFSNPFHKEFMESASTMAVPGYSPADCDDVVNALKLILGDVRKRMGDKITQTCLSGVSHGGYFTLMIAAREAAGQLGRLTFDRYVAVNPPPQLSYAAQRLDEMLDTPRSWPANERRKRMKNSLCKALNFAENGRGSSGNNPLTCTESDFLIGVACRCTLINVVADSQRRHNLGVLKVDPAKSARNDFYREIRQINYNEYTDRFVIPYLIKSGRITNREDLVAATDLDQYTEWLRNNSKIRVQICDDDFLLTSSDIPWFRATFGANLTDYATGGHLGNLHLPAVQAALVQMFSDKTHFPAGMRSVKPTPSQTPCHSGRIMRQERNGSRWQESY